VPLLAVSAVAVEFGDTRLLGGVTFTVARGDKWGIVGRNGSGKTTLLHILADKLQPSSGTVARAARLRTSVMEQHR
jgi:ATPase subunit of ABC transporter with duplicated ATPase domains